MMPRGPAAGWFPDPLQRFAQRYWDGSAWSEHVADAASRQTTDPWFVPAVPSAPAVQSAPIAQPPVPVEAVAAAVDETGELMNGSRLR